MLQQRLTGLDVLRVDGRHTPPRNGLQHGVHHSVVSYTAAIHVQCPNRRVVRVQCQEITLAGL